MHLLDSQELLRWAQFAGRLLSGPQRASAGGWVSYAANVSGRPTRN